MSSERNRRIAEAYYKLNNTQAYHDMPPSLAFKLGAEWADEHPDPWVNCKVALPPCGLEVYVFSTAYPKYGEWKTKRYNGCCDEQGFKITQDEYGFKTDHAPYYSPNMQITHWRITPPFPKESVLTAEQMEDIAEFIHNQMETPKLKYIRRAIEKGRGGWKQSDEENSK